MLGDHGANCVGGATLSERGMSALSLDEVRAIGHLAAREVASGQAEVVDVAARPDAMGDPAYYMSFRVADGPDDDEVGLFLRLSHRVRDMLVERGDDTYPLVELVGPLSRAVALHG